MSNFSPPPPLPPPSRLADLEDGHDAGWVHANSQGSMSTRKLAPISPSSSLFSGHIHNRRPEATVHSDPMMWDDLEGRQGRVPVPRSPEAQIRIEPPPPMDDGFRNSVGPLPGPASILQGERDFSRRNMKDASDSYDQHLLSKIGKPLSPPQSINEGRMTSTLTIPSRTFGGLPSPGGSDGSMLDVKWQHSPISAGGISPGTKVGWNYLDCRSPSVESSAPSSGVEHDHAGYSYRRRGGRTTPDTLSLPSRSNRGSYDERAFSDVEGDYDDSLPPRLFQVREATPPYLDHMRSGTKRRASSPPREIIADHRGSLHVTTNNGDLSQRRTSGYPFGNNLSVSSTYTPSHGSHSAASSISYRTSGSYSSAGLSVGASSMTSVSPYDRPSPGGLSPGLSPNSDLDSLHEKSIMNPSSPGALPGPAMMRPATSDTLQPPSAAPSRKVSLPNTLTVPKLGGPKVGGLYICDCCPKKPKKFDNPDELRAHEMEKQYSCQFCNNRFKNKNEAERHQNSLHLRRHSWSCAALPNFQAAFHSSGTTASSSSSSQSDNNSSSSSHDICGYCGEEFPNLPQPDWDRRFEHLTAVHKFGECNNAKKFFRADHFRQHLKHSHAGTSGKWTNILENACMKEEAPPEKKNASEDGKAGNSGSKASPSSEC